MGVCLVGGASARSSSGTGRPDAASSETCEKTSFCVFSCCLLLFVISLFNSEKTLFCVCVCVCGLECFMCLLFMLFVLVCMKP